MSYAIKKDGTGWRAVNEPSDVLSDENYSESMPGPIPPSPEQIRAQYEAAAQRALDDVAVAWGYDDLRSAVSYIGSKVAKWDAEGKALRDYRDDFWQAANAIKVSVQNGAAMPDTAAGFVAMLPAPPNKPAA